MTNLVLALAVFSFVVTGSLAHPGGATRNKCPPKPPTIQEFNATEVGNCLYLFRYHITDRNGVNLILTIVDKLESFPNQINFVRALPDCYPKPLIEHFYHLNPFG